MITRCPECGTKFRISVDLIRADDSSVRCGDCKAVFDARMQLVDEATESTYLTDSARERAARRRYEQHQAGLQHHQLQSHPEDHQPQHASLADGAAQLDVGSTSHGESWIDPNWSASSEQTNRPANTGATPETHQQRPRGHLIIDRRESQDEFDFDNADTIAYQPVDQTGAAKPHSSPIQAPPPVQSGESSPSQGAGPAEVDQMQATSAVLNDYSRRIDPLIDLDDKSIEFERTLALEGLTGIEPDYTEGSQGHRQVSNRSKILADSTTQQAGATSSYVGEHQFEAASAGSYTRYDSETGRPQTRLRTRLNYSAEPDIMDPPIGPPRSERHLDQQDQTAYRDGEGTDSEVADADHHPHREQRYPYVDDRRGNYPDDSAADRRGSSVSAISMRQHLNERGVAIEGDDDYDDVSQSGFGSLGWILFGLIALACAAAYYARDNIAISNMPQSVRAVFCSVAGCELPVGSNIADLELLRQKVYSHPNIDGALVVSIDVINNAVFPQPYPVLAITMANSDGVSVAERDFVPADYLENYAGTETLTAGKPTRINIEIVDPGADAQSFEMEFRAQ